MATTIQVSDSLLRELKSKKMHEKESYEEVIWDLLEDTMELSEETKQDIKRSLKEIKQGKTLTLDEVKRRLKIKNV
ncbi:hypothetical protein COV19_00780 [Candidatus Woesearchaeota archaeon CG10_big_fil_rev_8_21_14_0_10_44_13]|nr:MAG: hypothetical protein COV19_00780 [Candidatus Woesearchaeota archaeon CG10_big_fil_rev_8_21_14_0_10_44_13]